LSLIASTYGLQSTGLNLAFQTGHYEEDAGD